MIKVTVNSVHDPFGMILSGRNWNAGSGEEYRFGFNGKENSDEIYGDDNAVDFGARVYDSRLGRWLSSDPAANDYPFTSPYVFALNTPIQAIDPDGRLVIFVNGLPSFGACCPGTKEYWDYSYTDGSTGNWADDVMNQIGDHNAMYADGGSTWASGIKMRRKQGMAIGRENAETIIANLKRDENGKIIETVKFIAHSQGSATQRGISKALVKYVKEQNEFIDSWNNLQDFKVREAAKNGETYTPQYMKRIEGFRIEYVLDVSPWQGYFLEPDPNAEENYFMQNKSGFNQDTGIYGSKELGTDSNGEPKATDHGVAAFDERDIPKDTDGIDTKNSIELGDY